MSRALALAVVAIALVAIPAASALDIADTVPPAGKVGQPYSWTLAAREGSGSPPLTWVIPHTGVFPPGLSTTVSTDTRSATVHGTPTQAGVFRFFVQLRDSPGPWVCCTEEEFTITIDPGAQPPPSPPPVSAFPVTVLRQDATTLTLTWPQQKADGYVYFFGGLERARTRSPKVFTVRVSKGWPEYRVCPGDLVTGLKPCGVYRP